MGTFKVPVGAVIKAGAWTTSFGSDLDALNGVSGGNMTQTDVGQAICPPTTFVNAPAPGTYSLECSPATEIILDGTTPAGIGDLPPGFTITALSIAMTRLGVTSGVFDGGHNCIDSFTMTYGSTEVFNNPNISDGNHDSFFVTIFSLPSKSELFANHWACEQVYTAANSASTACGPLSYSSASLRYFSFYLQGDYEIRNKVLSVSFAGGRDLRFDGSSRNYAPPHWENPDGA